MSKAVEKDVPWSYGPWVLGCGLFGGIGGSPQLVGAGMELRAAFETMDEAVGLGINLFDTAEVYAGGRSEVMIGRWLRERSSATTSEVLLATKRWPPGSLTGDTEARLDAALPGGEILCQSRAVGC